MAAVEHPVGAVQLRRLSANAHDIATLQHCIEGAPRYARLLSGAPAGPNEGRDILAMLPRGKTQDDKFVFAIEADGHCVGCIDMMRGFPDPTTVHIGLLLVAEAHEGHGWGGAALAQIEAMVRAWGPFARLRIGIVENNARAFAFWTRHGFVPTGEVKPFGVEAVTSQVLIYTKPLA